MVDHAVDVAGGNQIRELRFPEHAERFDTVPVRLRDDADGVAVALEHARDDCRAKAGMVDIRIPGDKNKIELVDASRAHLLAADAREGILLFGHVNRYFPAVAPLFLLVLPAPRSAEPRPPPAAALAAAAPAAFVPAPAVEAEVVPAVAVAVAAAVLPAAEAVLPLVLRLREPAPP